MEHETTLDLDISKLKVPELKRELKLRGLGTQGNKIDLMERLQEALKMKVDETASATSADELEEDLLNVLGDDDEHLDDTASCITDIDNIESIAQKSLKRKSEDDKPDLDKAKVAKKIVLKRNSSHTEEPSINVANDIVAATDTLPLGSTDKKVIKLSELGMKERLEMRAKKFGVQLTGDAKKSMRAARFGGGTAVSNGNNTTAPTASIDVLKKRAERFGTSVSTVMTKLESQEKLEKRKQRFGSATNGSEAPAK